MSSQNEWSRAEPIELDEEVVFIYAITATPNRGKDIAKATQHALVMRLAGSTIPIEERKRQLVVLPLYALSPSSCASLCQSTTSILADAGSKWQLWGGSVDIFSGASFKRTMKGTSLLSHSVCPGLADGDAAGMRTPRASPSTKRLRDSSGSSSDASIRRANVSAVRDIIIFFDMVICV